MRILCLLLLTVQIYAQDVVYVTQWKSDADVDVIWVSSEVNADVVINVVNSRHEIPHYDNSWAFTTNKSRATIRIRVVSSGGNAVRVYKNKSPQRYLSYIQKRKYQKCFNNGKSEFD